MPTFDTTEPISVTVQLDIGDVRITAGDRADTTVEVLPSNQARESDVKAAEETRVEYADGKLLVKAPRQRSLFGRGGSVDVVAAVPTGSAVHATVGMADLRTEGRLGECRRKTGYGEVTVDRAHAAVSAKTAHGDVRVGEVVRGSITLETAYGELDVGIRRGTTAWLDVSSRSGKVRNSLGASDGPEQTDETAEVRAHTYYGDIVIRRA